MNSKAVKFFAKVMKQRRETLELSQLALAERAKIPVLTIRRVEHVENAPNLVTMEAIAVALDLNLSEMVP